MEISNKDSKIRLLEQQLICNEQSYKELEKDCERIESQLRDKQTNKENTVQISSQQLSLIQVCCYFFSYFHRGFILSLFFLFRAILEPFEPPSEIRKFCSFCTDCLVVGLLLFVFYYFVFCIVFFCVCVQTLQNQLKETQDHISFLCKNEIQDAKNQFESKLRHQRNRIEELELIANECNDLQIQLTTKEV